MRRAPESAMLTSVTKNRIFFTQAPDTNRRIPMKKIVFFISSSIYEFENQRKDIVSFIA